MSESVWLGTTSQKNFPSLDGDIEVDVAVVGGGITGVVAAYFLAKEGRRVAVIDLREPGYGETGHTTAHLTEQVDARFAAIRKRQGDDAARLVARAGRLAIETIASIASREKIDCAFEEATAFLYTDDEKDVDQLLAEPDLKEVGDVGEKAVMPEMVSDQMEPTEGMVENKLHSNPSAVADMDQELQRTA